MKKLLTEGVAIGNATARAITFAPRSPRYYIWPDRKWNTPFTGGGNYAFYDNGERMLDDRIISCTTTRRVSLRDLRTGTAPLRAVWRTMLRPSRPCAAPKVARVQSTASRHRT